MANYGKQSIISENFVKKYRTSLYRLLEGFFFAAHCITYTDPQLKDGAFRCSCIANHHLR